MSFFKQFPNATYQFEPGTSTNITDIFRHVDVNDRLASDINSYTYYEIEDGERPDNVSQKLYGTPDFYWTFFIVNESLKNGIDDWPKAYSAIEAELQLEYDNLGSMTFVPKVYPGTEGNGFKRFGSGTGDLLNREVDTSSEEDPEEGTNSGTYNAATIQNNFSGLDLSYSDLRVTRCLETAKIVNWNEKTLQLTMTDFSNKENFFALGDDALDRIAEANLVNVPDGGGQTDVPPIKLDNTWLNKMYFTFNDWPTIGKDGTNGTDFFPDILAGQQQNVNDTELDSQQKIIDADVLNQSDFTRKALNTMTIERAEWMVEVFRWLETQFVDARKSYPNLPNGRGKAYMPYEGFLYFYSLPDETFESAALRVWRQYFVPNYRTNQLKFKGFLVDKTHSNFREAPKYYYRNNDTEDIVNAYDVLGTSLSDKPALNVSSENLSESVTPEIPLPGTDPDRYVSHYDDLLNEKNKKSQIKVVKPELIRQFAQTYKNLIGLGSTLTSRVTGLEGTAVEGVGASQSVSAPTSGTVTSTNVSSGGSSGGGGY